jgi:hypothetical protein
MLTIPLVALLAVLPPTGSTIRPPITIGLLQ